MLEQIVKELAATVRDNVQSGIKALNEKFEPLIEGMKASQGLMKVDIQSALDMAAQAHKDMGVHASSLAFVNKAVADLQEKDDLSEFVKAFTEEMSNGA